MAFSDSAGGDEGLSLSTPFLRRREKRWWITGPILSRWAVISSMSFEVVEWRSVRHEERMSFSREEVGKWVRVKWIFWCGLWFTNQNSAVVGIEASSGEKWDFS